MAKINNEINPAELSDTKIMEDYISCAKYFWREDIKLFAREVFTNHLTINVPPFHDHIYSALQSIVTAERINNHNQLINKNVLNVSNSAQAKTSHKIQPTPRKPRKGIPPPPPHASLDVVIHPTPKSLQFSKVPMKKSNNNYEQDSGQNITEIIPEKILSKYIPTENAFKKNIVIVEPREFGKSTMAMIFVMWCIINRYKKFVLYISKSFDHAVGLVGPMKKEFESNEDLKDVYGDVRGGKWTESILDFNFGARIMAIGRGQSVRGLKYINHRPDLIILDDIEDDKSCDNKELRMELQEWLDKQVIPGVNSSDGNIAAFGTILHPDSLLANLSLNKNRLLKYTDFQTMFFAALDDKEESIWEDKFSTQALLDERRRDPYSFAQERMNQPIPLSAGMFKKEYFKYYQLGDEGIHLEDEVIPLSDCNMYLTCDLAMTQKEHSDYTVLLVCAISPKNELFVLEYTRKRWEDPDHIIEEMFRLNKKYPMIKVNGIETIAAQKWLMVNLNKIMRERDYFIPLCELKADKDKLRRISQLQPRFSNGAVYLRTFMADLEEELLLFPKSPHDDISDALAYILQIGRPGEKSENTKSRVRPNYIFSVSGEDVLKNLMERGKKKGVLKEYQTSEDFDPLIEDEFDNATMKKWVEED